MASQVREAEFQLELCFMSLRQISLWMCGEFNTKPIQAVMMFMCGSSLILSLSLSTQTHAHTSLHVLIHSVDRMRRWSLNYQV